MADASPIYEQSLKAIQETVGGHYAIAAVSDRVGEAELTLGAHPYWSSLQREDDPYWETINALHRGKTRVSTVTIDSLATLFNLSPPFLLKLDLQGGEAATLRGARETLKQTDVIICETDLAAFREVDRLLEDSGGGLFDVTELRRIADQSLGWFYPFYLNHRLDGIRRRSYWDATYNEMVIERQVKRRQGILDLNANFLAKLKAARATQR